MENMCNDRVDEIEKETAGMFPRILHILRVTFEGLENYCILLLFFFFSPNNLDISKKRQAKKTPKQS